jgi:hypothetical protein
VITYLIAAAIILIIISALLAPLEALGWWAGWYGEPGELDEPNDEARTSEPDGEGARGEDAEHYLVYLSGIGAMAGRSVFSEETRFVRALRANLPTTVVVDDVYPYSVTNAGLTGERVFASIWRWIERQRLKSERTLFIALVNVHNMLQIAVSADARYGPVYSVGVAQSIWRSLRRQGYRAGSGRPITLIGWSGGGQISVGVAPYLENLTGTRIRIISVAGVISSDPGVLRVEHLYQLYGTKDPIPMVGTVFYPGRWPIMARSAWNRAKESGRISQLSLGPCTHIGKGNYFDVSTYRADGRSNADYTLATMIDILAEAGVVQRREAFVPVLAE